MKRKEIFNKRNPYKQVHTVRVVCRAHIHVWARLSAFKRQLCVFIWFSLSLDQICTELKTKNIPATHVDRFWEKNEWFGQMLTFYLDFFKKKIINNHSWCCFQCTGIKVDIEDVTFKKMQRFHNFFFIFFSCFRMMMFWSFRRNF